MNKHSLCTINVVLIVIIILIQLNSPSLISQPKKGMCGISATISKGFIGSRNISTNTGSLNIGLAYLPSDHLSIRSELGFRTQKDTSGARNSEFTFTGNVWYYLHTAESMSTFIGGALGFGSESAASGSVTSLFSLSGYFGAEYWIGQRFSWFGHIGLVYASYSVAGKPASDVFTSATTGLTWYF